MTPKYRDILIGVTNRSIGDLLVDLVIDCIMSDVRAVFTKPWEKDYVRYWLDPFPEGEQDIWMITGNTDSSHPQSALCTVNFSAAFNSWSALARCALENKDESTHWALIDCSYDDEGCWSEEGSFYQRVQELDNPIETLKFMIDSTKMDPVLLVREHNCCLQWLTCVRDF